MTGNETLDALLAEVIASGEAVVRIWFDANDPADPIKFELINHGDEGSD